MGIYSKEAKKVFLESNNILGKASEDYYKSKMFFGYAQVYIDARNESEAKYFANRAINDFDTFCKCYKVDKGEKLNGIVLKPAMESANDFIACTSDEEGNIYFEHVIIEDGCVKSSEKKEIKKDKEEVKPVQEGKIIDFFKNFIVDLKTFRKEEKEKKELIKKFKKQGMSEQEAINKAYSYYSADAKAARKKAQERKEILKTYSEEEKKAIQNIINEFKRSFDKNKSKYKVKDNEGNNVNIACETISIEEGLSKTDCCLGYIYIEDVDTIKFDDNKEEIFDAFDNLSYNIDDDLKKFKVESYSAGNGRYVFYYIEKKNLNIPKQISEARNF